LQIFAGVDFAKMKANKNEPISIYAILDDNSNGQSDKYEEEWSGFWQFFNVMQFNPCFIAVSTTGIDQFGYLALKPATNSVNTAPHNETESDDWTEIMELLFEDDVKAYASELKTAGISAPDEVGYELVGNDGEVLATIEMAWIEQRVAYLTDEQSADKDVLIEAGWTIISKETTIDITIFGGGN
jgi:DEAD/DEAH box helicase domain-containing protein